MSKGMKGLQTSWELQFGEPLGHMAELYKIMEVVVKVNAELLFLGEFGEVIETGEKLV